MNTGHFNDFVKGVSARVNEIIDETKDLTPGFMSTGLFDSVKTDSLIYRTEGVTGLSYLEIVEEGDSLKYDRTYQAYKTEYVMKQSMKGVEISQLLMETRPAELEAKLDEVKQLRIAANRTLNVWAYQVLNNGFSTTDAVANLPISRLQDGVAMFSTAHPSKVSGVANRSNRLASDPVLSESNLFTAVKTIREQKNGRGLPIGYEGKFVLVVPPALEKTAVEITQSVLRSGTPNNDVNYFEGGIDVVSSVYLGAANNGLDTQWFVIAKDAMEKPLKYVSLIDPKIEVDSDFDTKSVKVSVDMACAFGYSSWEATTGSDGTND